MQIPPHLMEPVDRLLNGKATIEDRKMIAEWYDSESPEEMIINTGDSEADVFARVVQGIEQRTEEPFPPKEMQPRPPIRRIVRWTAAAAIVIAVGIGVSLYFHNRSTGIAKNENVTVPKVDIAPGTPKAVLTLADGRQITLDAAGKGLLAKEGGTQISIVDNGQLQYANELAADSKRGIVAPMLNTLAIPRGGEYQLQLSDGTKVWINAASTLRFPNVFVGGQRVVELLSGEAYFEVARNAQMPFIVKVPGRSRAEKEMAVEVLGTHFNINTYNESKTRNTTLLEGKVKVYTTTIGTAQPEHPQTLLPGQQSRLSSQGGIDVVTDPAVAAGAIAWKEGYFQFRETGLKEVMEQLSRWYDIDIEFQDGIVPSMAMMGRYSRLNNLSDALEMLRDVDIKYTISGRKLTILH